ncbi:MAG: hypothetical protein IAG13_23110 [Deltaproteobacteria bacterium]|nr:hypothetical protein [Nannocystaceae bacterium]
MPQLAAITTDFSDLETRLFAFDAAGSTRAADAFVRVEVLGAHALRRRGSTDRYPVAALRLPAMPGDFAHAGGDTIVVRSNDAALALALRRHAA